MKLVGELKKGVSSLTGNEWQSRSLMLEWLDREGTHRVWGTLFNQTVEEFNNEGIKVGDKVEASLHFTTRSFRSGYMSTDVKIEEIKKVQTI